MNVRFPIGSALLSAAILTASNATATTLELEYQSETSAFYDANDENALLVVTDYLVSEAPVNGAAVGAYRIKADLMGVATDFLAFCLEPLTNFVLPATYERINKFGEDVTTQLNMLAENAFELVQTHETAAAFQMAAWEIATEDLAPFNLGNGNFQITGDSTASNLAEGIAQDWLDNITNATWGDPTSSYMILSAEGNQDLLTNVAVSTVPLPTSGLMMATVALGAGALATRRRRVQNSK